MSDAGRARYDDPKCRPIKETDENHKVDRTRKRKATSNQIAWKANGLRPNKFITNKPPPVGVAEIMSECHKANVHKIKLR